MGVGRRKMKGPSVFWDLKCGRFPEQKARICRSVGCERGGGGPILEIWKGLTGFPEPNAKRPPGVPGCLRVIDESGQDYLYPAGSVSQRLDIPA